MIVYNKRELNSILVEEALSLEADFIGRHNMSKFPKN
jgi:hypothetical protein